MPEKPNLRAAGAVLWRPGPRAAEVGLVHRPKYDDWTFPKGKPKDGEHILRAAVREVEEETGLTPRLGRRLPATRYVKDGRVKQVEYWAATADGTGFVPNDEVDRLHWLPVPDAAELLSYDRDVHLLDEFGADPRLTVPVIILRHASAGEKRGWPDADALRPLDARGREQAAALAELLAAYGGRPVRLISSLAARCVETLIPYAMAAGSGISTEYAFTISGSDVPPDVPAARSRLADLLADGRPTVVCTHGELVEQLVAELCERFDGRRPADTSLPKSGFWVAHLGANEAGGVTLMALERHTV